MLRDLQSDLKNRDHVVVFGSFGYCMGERVLDGLLTFYLAAILFKGEVTM